MSIEKIDRNGIIILYKEQDWTSLMWLQNGGAS